MSHEAEECKFETELLLIKTQLLADASNDRSHLEQASGKEWEPDTILDNRETKMQWSAAKMQFEHVWSPAILHEKRKRNNQIRAKLHFFGYNLYEVIHNSKLHHFECIL